MYQNAFYAEITELRPRAYGGTFVDGIIEEFRFKALVFPRHAEQPDWEIGRSRILELLIDDRISLETMYNWKEGLVVSAKRLVVQEIVDCLAECLASYVFDDLFDNSTSRIRFWLRPTEMPTPGPFTCLRDYDESYHFTKITPCNDTSLVLAYVLMWADEFNPEPDAEANARLFAAAPELLAALRAMLAARQHGEDVYAAAVKMAIAAIDSVEGRIVFASRPNAT